MSTHFPRATKRRASTLNRRLPIAAAALVFISLVQAAVAGGPVPTPKEVLGYDLGARYTSYEGISKYIDALAASAPDRMKVITYGSTYEGRALRLAVVASPANLARLDDIRAASRKLADPRAASDAEAAELVRTMPAIAWLSYGVHGNEASSPEAALDVLYRLLSPADPSTAGLLDSLVVVIDPLLNPDGHERYVNFQVSSAGVKPREEPEAAEHTEGWPSGRSNHYLFDLNRDWAWLTQAESQARIAAYREWMPHVHVDFHEMSYNSSYFFFPAFKPVNKNFPASTVEWGGIYGRGNAEAFDRRGWTYYSGESFDLFYPGYGDSWPSLNGAIGMTYEQAGQVGVKVKRRDDEMLTLRDRLDHHSAASIATLATTAANRAKRLKDFHAFFSDAVAEGRSGPVKAFIVPPGTDPARSAKMVDLLIAQGVEVFRADGEFSAGDAKTYFPSAKRPSAFPAGSYVIRLDQPAKRLIMALMELEPAITDTAYYDISAWCLPVAYGVEAWWTSSVPGAASERIAKATVPAGSVSGGKARYGYVFPWTSNRAAGALARLLEAGYKAHTAMREFTLDGKRYGRGAIIVPVRSNPAGVDSAMASVAAEFGLEVSAANSGFTDSGMNLGSDRAVLLRKPKIAVLAGDPVSSSAYGAIWSMFDRSYGIDFVPVEPSRLARTDLQSYTAIVFPDDGAGGRDYAASLDSNFVKKLRTWISGGGTFVGIEGGAAFATKDRTGLTGVKLKARHKKSDDDKKKGDDKKGKVGEPDQPDEEELAKLMTVEEREKQRRREEIPGTIVSVRLDNSHPLGFGYDTTICVFRTSDAVFELSESGYNVGVYTKSPRVSGHMSAENGKFIAGTPFLIHEPLGSGNVILFADDPNFRLFWDGLNRIFLSSVLVMPGIRSVGMAASDGQE
jgi:hypothetical protein